ncbi:efflux RND transporter periplasmic adaptor subunit [Paremcibacter congregatus]|uniref:Efflux transporter periplasmic adaptor subunit n=1 Tax=Paremcibacter congregatus TaxID=2043170 RepID=A0A2G4YQX8_9PROT|nr:HlyD family efflux transporter periplasmic adaptor subunit [Paremcibacter congregatus]PHZ83866.1 hypothetical protein CRD36_16080 [Paremcibacter congregatus]QDE27571.1 HlyD family efflux transporter periplasmic adaptor subunit [Paremcibacter congregatus]
MVKKWLKTRAVLPVALAASFVVVSYALITTAPESKRKPAEYIAPMVEIMDLTTGSYDVTVQAQGLVGPAQQEVILRPQVGGKVIAIHPSFRPGGMIPAGEPIIQIEATDYELALREAEAKLARAMASVALEKGQQQIAKEEFNLLEGDFSFDETSKALALRKPQLRQFEAEQAIAQNAYDRAALALARTKLRLPYNALVLETSSAIGEVLLSGTVTGKLARADKFWVELRVQQKHMGRLHSKTSKKVGASVTIKSNGHEYQGEIVGLRANLVSTTRMGGAIVEVLNPLYSANRTGKPSLLIGSHVEATLDAGAVNGAFEIPRRALLDNDRLYVVDVEDKLQVRAATVLWEMPDSIIILPNLENNDRMIVSRVAGVAPGTKVNTRYRNDRFMRGPRM